MIVWLSLRAQLLRQAYIESMSLTTWWKQTLPLVVHDANRLAIVELRGFRYFIPITHDPLPRSDPSISISISKDNRQILIGLLSAEWWPAYLLFLARTDFSMICIAMTDQLCGEWLVINRHLLELQILLSARAAPRMHLTLLSSTRFSSLVLREAN